MTNLAIKAFVKIEEGKIYSNGELVYSVEPEIHGREFLKNAYMNLGMNYPKFYKMDELSKLALLCSEVMLRRNPVHEMYESEDISIFVSNSSSSLDSDIKHQESIANVDDFYPSPAVFVYTLPNILIGEIAIKYTIKGEQCFFISEAFDVAFMHTFVQNVLVNGEAEVAIVGWVDYFENTYKAVLYTVEKTTDQFLMNHTLENIKLIF